MLRVPVFMGWPVGANSPVLVGPKVCEGMLLGRNIRGEYRSLPIPRMIYARLAPLVDDAAQEMPNLFSAPCRILRENIESADGTSRIEKICTGNRAFPRGLSQAFYPMGIN